MGRGDNVAESRSGHRDTKYGRRTTSNRSRRGAAVRAQLDPKEGNKGAGDPHGGEEEDKAAPPLKCRGIDGAKDGRSDGGHGDGRESREAGEDFAGIFWRGEGQRERQESRRSRRGESREGGTDDERDEMRLGRDEHDQVTRQGEGNARLGEGEIPDCS